MITFLFNMLLLITSAFSFIMSQVVLSYVISNITMDPKLFKKEMFKYLVLYVMFLFMYIISGISLVYGVVK